MFSWKLTTIFVFLNIRMGFQASETQEEYRARPGLSEPTEFVPNPQGKITSIPFMLY